MGGKLKQEGELAKEKGKEAIKRSQEEKKAADIKVAELETNGAKSCKHVKEETACEIKARAQEAALKVQGMKKTIDGVVAEAKKKEKDDTAKAEALSDAA